MKLTFNLIVDTSTGEFEVINTETGETKSVKAETKKRTSSKKKKDDDPTPKITLEDNKYCLNSAAVDLMGVEPDDRLDIKMEKQGKNLIPVIGNDLVFKTHQGNRVTKSFTVSCRGKANDELSKYGSVFTLEPHPSKDGLFIMVGDKEAPEAPPTKDENIEIPEDENLPMDADLEGLVEDDNEAKEITAFDFNL